MAFLTKLKKGGVARWVLFNATQNDTFVIPRGFRVRYLGVETLKTVASGTNTFGVGVTAGVVPVQTLTSNTVAVGGAGTTVTIDGVAVTVAQLDAASVVMDKIMAAYTAGSFVASATTSVETWTMVRTSATVITMTGSAPQTVAAVTVNVGTITGFTLTSAQVTAGSVDVTAVNATTLSNYRVNTPGQNSLVAGTFQAGFDYNAGTTSPSVYSTFTYTSTTGGTFKLNGTTFTPASAGTQGAFATAIAAAVNSSTNATGLQAFTTATTGQVVFVYSQSSYSKTSGATITYDFSGLTGGAAGTVYSTSADKTYYVTLAGPYADQLARNVNVYAILEKLN